MTSFFKTKTQRLSLILCLAALSFLVIGCSGPTFQGWSGFAASDNVVYFGGIDGKVYAISPTARSQMSTFPSQDEWVFSIPSLGASGAICGPSCAPASPRASIYATPVVLGDLVYVGVYAGENGKLIAIDRLAPGYTEGVPQRSKGEWTYPSGVKSIGAIVGSPVVVDETLYAGSSDGKLYAIDAVYGEKKWEFDTGGKIWTSPVVEGGVVYVSNYNRKLSAVSSTDGTLIWQTELSSSIASSPAVSGDNVFLGTFDNHLYAIDRTSGKEKWSFEGSNWFWSTPIVKDGTVYAGCLDNKIYAIDAGTGKELWQFVADGPIVSKPVLANNLIVVASQAGDIYVLDSDKGNLVQSVHIGYPVMAPLFVKENMVYVHAGNLCVYGIDMKSGEKAWEFCYYSTK
jgi:eukaryotic-like serine/threonine-protein kinase